MAVPPGPALPLAAPTRGETVTGTVMLRVGGAVLPVEVTVPAGPTRLEALLPIFQGLASYLADQAEERQAAAGRPVSCRAGCGACCRQGVPVSPSEARALARLVAAMPPRRRGEIRRRFADARARVAAAGAGIDPDAAGRVEGGSIARGLGYFALGIPCPFLEAESCSIHPDRPIACREFLVTSPAAACAAPSRETIERVPLDGQVARAFRAAEAESEGKPWLLLVDALDWAAAHPAPTARATGPELVQ